MIDLLCRCLCLLLLFPIALGGRAARAVDANDVARVLLEEAIAAGQMAGAVVMMSRDGKMLYSAAVGHAQIEPEPRPMELSTVFDLASLTKSVATATSVMCLVDQGHLRLDTNVATYLPEFSEHGKSEITVADLLLHRGGLIADNALSDYGNNPQRNWENICQLKPLAPPGERFIYSDVGFIVLGQLIERVSGQRLDAFAAENIFAPLKMSETRFNPPEVLRRRAAATETRDGEWLIGRVHDPRAARMDGVAGHAGLFSTAADLMRFGQALCNGGQLDGTRILSDAALTEMTTARSVPRGMRAYGWDVRSPYSSNRATAYSDAAYGHGGFTGTVLWIDPVEKVVFVFLSNRLHPDGKGSVNGLAAKVADQLLSKAASKP